MKERSSGNNLQNILDEITASEVVETRVHLFNMLCDIDFHEKTELISLIGSLAIFWEDFTCLDVSQCKLNQAILNVAAKYVDLDLSGCLMQFLDLVTKASVWCRKHLKMTVMSSEDSQEEEHGNLFFQLLLDLFSLSADSTMALTKYPVSTENAQMIAVEGFVLEQLNLAKDLVSEIKKIPSTALEILKVAQKVIDAQMKLCKDYFSVVNWDSFNTSHVKDKNIMQCDVTSITTHVISITKCTIEKLCELGILAANDGGNLVAILNVSWKGVISLLELCKGSPTEIVNVQDIILTLISLVNAPLRCAAETWSSSLSETVAAVEARRIFLPVKFYLVNAVRICSLYPCQAYLVYREVTLCVLIISSFKLLLSHEKLLNTASQVFLELLEKTYVDLLFSLLNSEVKEELKFKLLDWLFKAECCSSFEQGDLGCYYSLYSVQEIFSVSCEVGPKSRALLLSRVVLFCTLLRYSNDLEEGVNIQLTRKLGLILDILLDEGVYSSILYLQIPFLHGSGKTAELIWQPMFSALIFALKTLMIVVFETSAWVDFEVFLLENLFHPHLLCWEIIIELWSFLVRNAEVNITNGLMVKLCSLMKSLAFPDLVFLPGSPLRKLAKIVCLLLHNVKPSVVDQVYSSVASDDGSQMSAMVYAALLLEDFPLNSLSDSVTSVAKHKIVSDYFGLVSNFEDKLVTDCSFGELEMPVLTLSASLHSRQVNLSDIELKTLKFLIAITRNLRSPTNSQIKEQSCRLLSSTLEIFSTMKNLYESSEVEEVILELHNLFVSGPTASDAKLYQCKPYLALFMGGLGGAEMSERDDCAKSSAVWELYHMLFRERHWALVHLAIVAFGCFAASTSCNHLWRFIPQDAALSYDMSADKVETGRFMSELKAFLEKEMTVLATSLEQRELLVKEGMVLKEIVQQLQNLKMESTENMKDGNTEIQVDNQSNKRRKLPDGISRGVELLQSGLKLIGEGLSQWQQIGVESSELQCNFLTHFSHLEDAITHITGLAGTSKPQCSALQSDNL